MRPINFKDLIPYLIWGTISIAVGVAVILLGDKLLGVQLEIVLRDRMATYNIFWIMDLILVPIIAGFVVTFIYGLGGKIVAHFPPLIAKCYLYFTINPDMIPQGAEIIPVGFWILIVIVAVEAGAAGGLIGEIVIKKIYGRRPKHLVHKRYRRNPIENQNL